jgi:hypothetical protein
MPIIMAFDTAIIATFALQFKSSFYTSFTSAIAQNYYDINTANIYLFAA